MQYQGITSAHGIFVDFEGPFPGACNDLNVMAGAHPHPHPHPQPQPQPRRAAPRAGPGD